MKFVITNDHGGLSLVKTVESTLLKLGNEVEHLGSFDENSVDYPDFAQKACKKILENKADFAVLICGTGIGMSIAANKIKGIRAAAVSETYSAKMSRRHNDANVLCLGARVIGTETCKEIVEAFANEKFEGQRHINRLNKIKLLEEKYV